MCPPSLFMEEVLLGLSVPHKKAFKTGDRKEGKEQREIVVIQGF